MVERNLEQLSLENAAITKKKGFDTSQHALQLMLIADEVMEAMEHLSLYGSPELFELKEKFKKFTDRLRYLRKNINLVDMSKISDNREEDYIEELVDIFIRLFSYIGSNFPYLNLTDKIVQKMNVNKKRPVRHGKKF